jgi:hypothetical protein
MRPKWFSSQWYFRCKPCTYLAPILTMCPNGPKRDSTWPSSPSSSIMCIQNDFQSLWYVRRKLCTHLALTLTLYPNGPKRDSTDPSHLGNHWVRPKWFPSLWYVRRKPCTYVVSRVTLSPNRSKRASTWAMSPRSTIGWVQHDIWAYSMFDTNRVPILHRHKHCL